ncbi:aldehyde dehydrogenase family protein [Celeribacter sp.]|uniref:aldehyde dehydrogenase family protein n=1 Tax=Celeribacter sp. TaxID=1890673 RepID=UPI003A943535
MHDLNDASLLKGACLIDGGWQEAASGAVVRVLNPADGSLVGTVPALSNTEIEAVIAHSERAQRAWAARPAAERSAILRQWFGLITDAADDLARIMTLEQGKPLHEARGEIRCAASFIEWFAEEAKRVYGDIIPAPSPGQRFSVLRQPVGVTAAITPWNFPPGMITRKVAPALAA